MGMKSENDTNISFEEESIFDLEVSRRFIARIERLNSNTTPLWGKMNAGQMLAHCSGAFEHKSSSSLPILTRLLIKIFRREIVIGNKPYPKGMKTSKAFVIDDHRDFDHEKTRLIAGIQNTQKLGESFFKNRKHPIFGKITVKEWNTFLVKHLNHHLNQFGV